MVTQRVSGKPKISNFSYFFIFQNVGWLFHSCVRGDDPLLLILRSLQEVNYSQIMQVYEESNKRYADAEYPRLPCGLRVINAEQDFYAYLREFFSTDGAMYAIWSVDGEYKSALRMEPYADGYLLAGLETAPAEREKGYAKQLIRESLSFFRKINNAAIYSHVDKDNIPSLAVHKACGFVCIREDAEYIDGTHKEDAYTLMWK